METKKYIALITAIVVLGGGAFLTQKWFTESSATISDSEPTAQITDKEPTPSQLSSPIPTPQSQETPTPKAPQGDSFTFTAAAEGTVLDAMNALVAEGKLSFSGRDFAGLGFFVEEINRKKSADGYYWILLVNGVKSELGASSAQLAPGDRVEWKYEKGY